MALPKPAGLSFDGNQVTDHQRSPIDIEFVPINTSQRMWDGTLRRRQIAEKRNVNASWELLPGPAINTVDGHWGANDMKAFYESLNGGDFELTITYTNGSTETIYCVFNSFSMSLAKRGAYDMYSVSLSLEEV